MRRPGSWALRGRAAAGTGDRPPRHGLAPDAGGRFREDRDPYGGPVRTFFFVALPATPQGAAAGLVLVFLPATGIGDRAPTKSARTALRDRACSEEGAVLAVAEPGPRAGHWAV